MAAEDARKGAESPRMPAVELAVGTQVGVRPGEEPFEIAFDHARADDALDSLLALAA